MKSLTQLSVLIGTTIMMSFTAHADLREIGSFKNGVYEPGYVNYSHARSSSDMEHGGLNTTGFVNSNGVYEPNYRNYRTQPDIPAVKHENEDEYLTSIGSYNNNNIYEPGYVNYRHKK